MAASKKSKSKTNFAPYPAKAPRAPDVRAINLLNRWSAAHPSCYECQYPMHYLHSSESWACQEHGEQLTAQVLVYQRGYYRHGALVL